MAATAELIYWDANIFLAFLDEADARRAQCADVLERVFDSKGKLKIVTSAFSKVEVAFVQSERDTQTLSAEVEKKIDDLWIDDSVIEVIELSDEVASEARKLIRRCVAEGKRRLKPGDAVHLASARFIGARTLHTFNLKDFAGFQGELGLTSAEPEVPAPRLPDLKI